MVSLSSSLLTFLLLSSVVILFIFQCILLYFTFSLPHTRYVNAISWLCLNYCWIKVISLQKPFTCTKLYQDIVVAVVSAPDGVQIHCRTLPSFILLYSVSVFFLFFSLLQQIEVAASATNKELLSPFQAATATAEHPPTPTPDSPGPMIDCSLSAFVPGNCFVLLTVCLRPGPDSRDIAPPFLRLSAPMCLKPRPSELQWNM